jgi:CRISPR-associated protein Cas1
MDEPLWPARGVAEHAYCPRLFYYMTVEACSCPAPTRSKAPACIDAWTVR